MASTRLVELDRNSSQMLEDDDISLSIDYLDGDLDGNSAAGSSLAPSENAENANLKNETRKTSVIRCLVITTLLTTAAIVANVALIITLTDEEVQFKTEYSRLSNRLVERFFQSFSEKISAADSLVSQLSFAATPAAAAAAAAAVDNSSNFSFNSNITIPNFELQAEGIRQLSSATTIFFSPIVQGSDEERAAWEAFAFQQYDASQRDDFVSTYLAHDGKYNYNSTEDGGQPLMTYRDTGDRSVQEGIYAVENGMVVTDNSNSDNGDVYAPIWQMAPFNNATDSVVMFNQMSEKGRKRALDRLLASSAYVVSGIFHNDTSSSDKDSSLHVDIASPLVAIFYPVMEDMGNNNIMDNNVVNNVVVGVLTMEVGIESLFENVLEGFEYEPVTVVVSTSCDSNDDNDQEEEQQSFSFLVRGASVSYLGPGDQHETIPDVGRYEMISSTHEQFNAMIQSNANVYPTPIPQDILCSYRVDIYPTDEFHIYYLTTRPVIIEAMVGLVFLFTVGVFLAYDCLVERRQRRILLAAQKNNALVSSLFPKAVRDRLYNISKNKPTVVDGCVGDDDNDLFNKELGDAMENAAPKLRLKKFMAIADNKNKDKTSVINTTEPIADLFPNASIMFADIAGFTAWSSEREPSQVFALLETLYGGIDNIARKLGVFKVETVGDCYVAATGIPEARTDHALILVRFANAMLFRVNDLTTALESTLGPGTADLGMRVGIHSGPVTAGVLRGEKSRFQLFGDTMNTASRMESTSIKGRIQVSNDTAVLLVEGGKGHWIEPRADLVDAKGKGQMQTYWLKETTEGRRSSSVSFQSLVKDVTVRDEVKDRLIDWNVQVMMTLIEKIVARRGNRRVSRLDSLSNVGVTADSGIIIDEVKEVVELPKFNADVFLKSDDRVTIPGVVRSELRDYISQIAASYNDNPFHNFEHASHVCLSAHKLLKRITRPDEVNYAHASKAAIAQDLHEHTYGISSDPLTQLAMVFAALIHDAGHTGVPNGQLAKEFPSIAAKYGHQSIAEQRSVDISWELLQEPCYSHLRACMFPLREEQVRFRQLIVNSVVATDIFDKELGAERKIRWAKAFGPEEPEWTDSDTIDRKATIVIEHVIQASDVAHTMQHWHVYQKWNEYLYQEMHLAFLKGRADKDPSLGWYKGELWFFDNYVIPLAKKLKECGVFGVSSDEYLNYAIENRQEWEIKGEDIVARMHASMSSLYPTEEQLAPEDRQEWEIKGEDIVARMHASISSLHPTEEQLAPEDNRPEETIPVRVVETRRNIE